MASKSTKRTWTVEGVDAEAASMAKAAAEAAGMSVSDWLSKVILESTRPGSGRGLAARAPRPGGDSFGRRGGGADTGDDDRGMGDEVAKARESLEQFLQAVIEDANGRPRLIDEPELGDAASGAGRAGELPLGRAAAEVEINRESVVLPQGAVVFETARAAGGRDTPRAAPWAGDDEDDMATAAGAPASTAGSGTAARDARERPPPPDTEIISPLTATDSDFAEPDSKPARAPAASADAAAHIGVVGLSAREPADAAPADAPAPADESLPDWYQSEVVDDWTLRPDTGTDALDLAGDGPILPPGLPPGLAPSDTPAAPGAAEEPAPAAEAVGRPAEPLPPAAPRNEDIAVLPLEADWQTKIPAGAAPTADLTWWERLEAEQKDSAGSAEPAAGSAAHDRLEASNLAVVRAMVTGEDRMEPERRPFVRWLLLLLLLALLGGGAVAAWRYPEQLSEIRQRIGAVISGDPAHDRQGSPEAAPVDESGPAGESEAPVERLPLDDAPDKSSRAPAEQPPAARAETVPGAPPAAAESEVPAATGADGKTPRPPGPPEQNVAWYKRAAAAGNAAAQTVLAGLYADGVGVAQDHRKAAGWYRLAAAAGIADAQYALGELYQAGRGVSKDELEAVVWYELAARQKHAQAEYQLGLASLEGIGTPINFAAARNWFERAARQGIPAAKYQLGLMYRDGLGVAIDNALAFRWLTEAGQLGHRPAIQALRELMPRISGEDLLTAGQQIRQEDDSPAPAPAQGLGAAAPEPAPEPEVVKPLEPAAADEGDAAIIGPAMPASGPPPSQPPQIAAEDGSDAGGSRGKTIVIADPALVAEIQALLRQLKLMAGRADGRLTEETQQAIATYQRIAGLEPDGMPTPALRNHLRSVLSGAPGN